MQVPVKINRNYALYFKLHKIGVKIDWSCPHVKLHTTGQCHGDDCCCPSRRCGRHQHQVNEYCSKLKCPEMHMPQPHSQSFWQNVHCTYTWNKYYSFQCSPGLSYLELWLGSHQGDQTSRGGDEGESFSSSPVFSFDIMMITGCLIIATSVRSLKLSGWNAITDALLEFLVTGCLFMKCIVLPPANQYGLSFSISWGE